MGNLKHFYYKMDVFESKLNIDELLVKELSNEIHKIDNEIDYYSEFPYDKYCLLRLQYNIQRKDSIIQSIEKFKCARKKKLDKM